MEIGNKMIELVAPMRTDWSPGFEDDFKLIPSMKERALFGWC
jgi:hypothetical protein